MNGKQLTDLQNNNLQNKLTYGNSVQQLKQSPLPEVARCKSSQKEYGCYHECVCLP